MPSPPPGGTPARCPPPLDHAPACYILSSRRAGLQRNPRCCARRAQIPFESHRSQLRRRLCLEVHQPSMAESTSVALAATTIPSSADIARAEKLVRERFLHDGEDAAVALAARTPRRRALAQALADLAEDPKAKQPSTGWRREFSLLLGLERLLSDEEPKLADGT